LAAGVIARIRPEQLGSPTPCTEWDVRSAPRVFVIVDNGSDHRGEKAARRLRDAYPNAIMIGGYARMPTPRTGHVRWPAG